jgi:2-methylisocitrate lyase-like PEP mutase family enzyme
MTHEGRSETLLADRVATFRDLHASGCFVIPNPWDAGSAKLLEQLGFRALASSSSGLAWSLGKADTRVSLEEALAHFRVLSASVAVPVQADFEGGYAIEPANVAANVALACETGVAGISIEDSTGEAERPLFDETLAIERIVAAKQAIDASGTGILLTARSEGFIAGRPDLEETIRRLRAFADAGADCLFAPGLRSMGDIRAVVQAVAPKPLNVLVGSSFATLDELTAVGVRRVSVGGALARAAWNGFLVAARTIAETGSFAALEEAVTYEEMNRSFDGS